MIINRITGKEPTAAELKQIQEQALEIFRSPYSSPEQMVWAVDMYPEGFAETFVIDNRPEWVRSIKF